MQIGILLTQNELHGHKDWVAGFYYIRNCVNALAMLSLEEMPEIILFIPETLTVPIIFPENADKVERLTIVRIPDDLINDYENYPRLQQYLDRYSYDLLFPLVGVPRFNFPTPIIGWIPDFQHKHLPEFFSENERQARDILYDFIVYYCNKVACSSQTVQTDLHNFYPSFRDKGVVLKFTSILPEEHLIKNPEAALKRLGLAQKYIYMPNQFWIHKNHKIVFEAWKQLQVQGFNYLLICTGHNEDHRFPGYYQELERYLDDNGLRNNVRLMGFLSREDQVQVYRGASAILQPSLFEGWSTSIEDSKTLGKPLFVSDIPVHREQCGSDAHYFDKNSAEALATIVQDLWNSLPSGYDSCLETKALARSQTRAKSFGRALVRTFQETLDTKTRSIQPNDNERFLLPMIYELGRKLDISEADREARLRAIIDQQAALAQLNQHLQEMNVDYEARLRVILEQQTTIAEQQATIANLTQHIEAVSTDYEARLQVILEQQTKLAEQQTKLAELEGKPLVRLLRHLSLI